MSANEYEIRELKEIVDKLEQKSKQQEQEENDNINIWLGFLLGVLVTILTYAFFTTLAFFWGI